MREVPEAGLYIGDVATLIDYVPHPAGGEEGADLRTGSVNETNKRQ